MSKSRVSCFFSYIYFSQTGLGSPFGGPVVLCLAQSYDSCSKLSAHCLLKPTKCGSGLTKTAPNFPLIYRHLFFFSCSPRLFFFFTCAGTLSRKALSHRACVGGVAILWRKNTKGSRSCLCGRRFDLETISGVALALA